MSVVDIDTAGCRYVVLSGGIGGAKLAQGLSLLQLRQLSKSTF